MYFAIFRLNFGDNVVYFYTPSEVVEKAPKIQFNTIKVGGMVKTGSIKWDPENLKLSFILSNLKGIDIEVNHSGTPPDMFKENAGVIVEGKITTLNEADLLARMLVQTSRCEGLSMVYMDLVGFEGNEFYFFRPDQGWGTQNFGELQFHFMETVPLGVRNSKGMITMNPPLDYVLKINFLR